MKKVKEFIQNSTRTPTAVTLCNTESCLVDLRSTDSVKAYTLFLLKKVYKGKFDLKWDSEFYVGRKNGNIEISDNNGTRYWSSNTINNIENFINTIISNKEKSNDAEQIKQAEKDKFLGKLKSRFPNIKWEDNRYTGSVYAETNLNGIDITIEDDWDIEFSIPRTENNVYKMIEFLEAMKFETGEQ